MILFKLKLLKIVNKTVEKFANLLKKIYVCVNIIKEILY